MRKKKERIAETPAVGPIPPPGEIAAGGRWFDTYTIPVGSMGFFAVGALELRLIHQDGEWRVAYRCDPWDNGDAVEVRCPLPAETPPEGFEVHRFPSRSPADRIRVGAALADRPIVVRPEQPIHLAAGDEVEIFVGTPVWVRLEIEEPSRRLLDLPSQRLTDTWIGPDTRRGELGYASRTAAKIHYQNIQLRPHRAITRVTLRNFSGDDLKLERLSIPTPNLELFVDATDRLWTQSILAHRIAGGSAADVELQSGPPEEAKGALRLAFARDRVSRTMLQKALSVLVG